MSIPEGSRNLVKHSQLPSPATQGSPVTQVRGVLRRQKDSAQINEITGKTSAIAEKAKAERQKTANAGAGLTSFSRTASQIPTSQDAQANLELEKMVRNLDGQPAKAKPQLTAKQAKAKEQNLAHFQRLEQATSSDYMDGTVRNRAIYDRVPANGQSSHSVQYGKISDVKAGNADVPHADQVATQNTAPPPTQPQAPARSPRTPPSSPHQRLPTQQDAEQIQKNIIAAANTPTQQNVAGNASTSRTPSPATRFEQAHQQLQAQLRGVVPLSQITNAVGQGTIQNQHGFNNMKLTR